MRYPEGHKSVVRARIVEEASAALREHGIGGLSIPALMKRAGLTHGGFYAHFRDRDELVADAITSAANETGQNVFGEGRDLDRVLDTYLSREHVDEPAHGCVLAALGTDGTRHAAPIRRAFADAARGLLRLLEQKGSKKPAKGKALSDETLVRASTMLGAVVLGRLVDDEALSERILSAAKRACSG